MIDIYQRKIVLLLLGVQSAGGGLILALSRYSNLTTTDVTNIGIAFIFVTGCLVLYWRYNWTTVVYINILNAIILIGALIVMPLERNSIATIIFLPAALAVVTLKAQWTLIAGFSTYFLIFIRADSGSPYREPDQIIVYSMVIACLFAGRRIVEQAQQEDKKALHEVQKSQQILEASMQQASIQAKTLEQKHLEQIDIVKRVAHLELPFVPIATQILLVPLLGHLNHNRIDQISTRLLEHINREPTKHIVIDFSGVHTINPSLITNLQGLIQSIRLLGSGVTFSGIMPDVARTLALEKIDIKHIQIVQTPYDSLEQVHTNQIKTEQH